jgi:fructokinase
MSVRLGVDFGGSKIEAALMARDGRLLARRRTPNPGDYQAALAALADLVAAIEAEAGARGAVAGAAMPGSVSPATGLVRNANSTWLNGRSFREDLQRVLARPVRVQNDANCFALSEALDGAGAGRAVVFGIILGSGCGGGLVIDGRLVTGRNDIAGEWGHTPLPWARAEEITPRCWCGRFNCVEQWISGNGFRRWAGLSGEEANAAALAGDPRARVLLDLLGDRIARSLAVVIDVLDPDVIVFGGGLSNVQSLYASVRGKLIAHIFSDALRTEIVQNRHGDSSGVRGAAWLFSPEEAA